MKFLLLSLITYIDGPKTAEQPFRSSPPVFTSVEDAVERSSALVGSPQQIIDKVHRCHQRFGHEITHLSADTEGLTEKQNRAGPELFASDIAPVLSHLKGR